MSRNNASARRTRPSDIAAFKHKHPLDSHVERTIAEFGNQYVVEIKGTFEIFRFTAPEYGEVIFDIRGIKDALAENRLPFQMMQLKLDAGLVEHVRRNNGVEAKRMAELTAADLERPGIMAQWPDQHTSCIDGNNRLVRRWDDGLRTYRFALILMNETIQPYICRPGQEDHFLDRKNQEQGVVSIRRMIAPHQ